MRTLGTSPRPTIVSLLPQVKAWRRAEALLALVLPSGFPASVRFPYGEYAAWQFVGMAASAAAGVMSTQSLVRAPTLLAENKLNGRGLHGRRGVNVSLHSGDIIYSTKAVLVVVYYCMHYVHFHKVRKYNDTQHQVGPRMNIPPSPLLAPLRYSFCCALALCHGAGRGLYSASGDIELGHKGWPWPVGRSSVFEPGQHAFRFQPQAVVRGSGKTVALGTLIRAPGKQRTAGCHTPRIEPYPDVFCWGRRESSVIPFYVILDHSQVSLAMYAGVLMVS